MQHNEVWEVIDRPQGIKPIGCKRILKTNKDSIRKINYYKSRLVAIAFTQRQGIDNPRLFHLFHQRFF